MILIHVLIRALDQVLDRIQIEVLIKAHRIDDT